MYSRDLIKMEIDMLPDDIIDFVYNFIFFLKQQRISQNTRASNEIKEGYEELLKFKGTLNRDVDVKKERLEYIDEKYNRIS